MVVDVVSPYTKDKPSDVHESVVSGSEELHSA